MSERDRYIPGVPCWIEASQPDVEAAREFYSGLFGWECENVMPDAEQPYYVARIGGRDVAAICAPMGDAPPIAYWNTYVWVDSADEAAARASGAGGTVLAAPFDVGEAGRMAVLADPSGAVVCPWEARGHRGAQLINEHGGVNFNDLHTRDLEGARRFYGEVFGWKVMEMEGGFTTWTLPGYGEFLDQINPGTLAGMADMGAPAGFADVVASLAELPADQPEVPAHWGVTFAVDDADAIAARAAELGATVIVPPFDAPWVRMAVIADPMGRTFVASKFVPENKDLQAPAGAGATAA